MLACAYKKCELSLVTKMHLMPQTFTLKLTSLLEKSYTGITHSNVYV